MKCRRVRHLLFDFVDGLGNEALHAEVDRHLAECVECEKFAAETTRSLAFLRRAPVEMLDENFNWKVRLAIHREQRTNARRTASAGAWVNAWNHRYAASAGIAFALVLVAGAASLRNFEPSSVEDRLVSPTTAPRTEVAQRTVDRAPSRPSTLSRSPVELVNQGAHDAVAPPAARGAIDPYAAEVAIDSLIDARLVDMTPERRMRCIQRQIHRLQSQLESQRAPVSQP
jgi:anti-sigma factor RsiW